MSNVTIRGNNADGSGGGLYMGGPKRRRRPSDGTVPRPYEARRLRGGTLAWRREGNLTITLNKTGRALLHSRLSVDLKGTSANCVGVQGQGAHRVEVVGGQALIQSG
jgi:hypothetical protein